MSVATLKRRDFPKDGVCKCGANDWYDVEVEYTRMSSAEYQDGALQVFMNGWDDMSEGGNGQYAVCAACTAEYESPDQISYS